MPQIALLQGDGIGPEITLATRRVLETVSARFGLDLEFQDVAIGFTALKAHGSTFPDDVMPLVADCDAVILGPVSHNEYPPRAAGGLNPSAELRKRLDLFANIRPACTRAGIKPRAGVPLDLVVVRENTEGFYADRNMHQGPGEMMVTGDVAIALRRISRPASMRIARTAFALAKKRSGRVTAVHKANVMRTTCGLFLECCRICAADNPDIDYQEQLVDAMCAHLVRTPDQHDVIVTTNMFGDILSDLAAELAGSLGLAASLNAGEQHAMAQAQHGSAPGIAGQDRANPSSLIGSAAMMLDWLGQRRGIAALVDASRSIEHALDKTLSSPANRTPDLGGAASTTRMTDAIVERLQTIRVKGES